MANPSSTPELVADRSNPQPSQPSKPSQPLECAAQCRALEPALWQHLQDTARQRVAAAPAASLDQDALDRELDAAAISWLIDRGQRRLFSKSELWRKARRAARFWIRKGRRQHTQYAPFQAAFGLAKIRFNKAHDRAQTAKFAQHLAAQGWKVKRIASFLKHSLGDVYRLLKVDWRTKLAQARRNFQYAVGLWKKGQVADKRAENAAVSIFAGGSVTGPLGAESVLSVQTTTRGRTTTGEKSERAVKAVEDAVTADTARAAALRRDTERLLNAPPGNGVSRLARRFAALAVHSA